MTTSVYRCSDAGDEAELRAAGIELAARTRKAQGLPPTIRDRAVAREVARLLVGEKAPPSERTAAPAEDEGQPSKVQRASMITGRADTSRTVAR